SSLPTLLGNGFFLRPWHIEDAGWYVQSRDEEVFRWTTERRNLTVEETRVAIEQANVNPNAVCLAIVEKESENLLGNIALAMAEDRQSAEVMYWLAPAGRGRGIATNAVKLLCNWAFEALDLEQITLKTYLENAPSQAVAHRAGFTRKENQAEVAWFELDAPKF
ncbi:MAG: GNAT family N-acetyltransferase, partial [candidate division Zixibacteria bacterium]|nr:GNAT family N-acetyltransferase [candidate division Zixibacteria bacterium]